MGYDGQHTRLDTLKRYQRRLERAIELAYLFQC